MRVLVVSHLFPPAHSAGTEVYAAELAGRIAGRGASVLVLTTEKDVSRRDLALDRREHAGLEVRELVNNLYLEDFRQTWRRPEVDRRFGELLDEWRPDLVHFHHLMYLSAGCLEEAGGRGLPVVWTLHDFWLECPRFGQLVHADGGLCERVELERCGSCLPSFEWRQHAAARRVGPWIAGLRERTGLDLGPAAVALSRRARAAGAPAAAPEAEERARWARLAGERVSELRALALAHVDRFVAPSRFLRRRFLDFGLPPERVLHHPTGVDLDRFARAERGPRAPGAPLRVGFLGTYVPVKGAALLLAAWRSLPQELRARGELRLHGPGEHAPEHVAELGRQARALGATLGGPLERAEVARFLAETDLLVVPSLWYENRPLVAVEALATRTPLLVSDLGGLAELVVEGAHGWRFPAGDEGALAARLGALLADPTPLDGLYREPVQLPSWDGLADATFALYHELLEGGAA